jgi:hypothetical protein
VRPITASRQGVTRKCKPKDNCDHPWYCYYATKNVRYRMSIPQVFHENPKTRTEATHVWLPKFINAINEAIREGREPFAPAKATDTNALTVADFIDVHFVPRYYQADSISEIKSPDARSKMKLLRRDLGDLRLKQLESKVVVDDYKKQLQARGVGAPGYNRRLSKLRQMLTGPRIGNSSPPCRSAGISCRSISLRRFC